MFLLNKVIAGPECYQVSIVRRCRDGDTTRTPDVRVAQLVRQHLEVISREVIVVPEHVVVRRPTRTLPCQQCKQSISICTSIKHQFDSNWNWNCLIRFKSGDFQISHTCGHTTSHAHCSTKNFDAVIEIFFMFMILRLCSKSIHTR